MTVPGDNLGSYLCLNYLKRTKRQIPTIVITDFDDVEILAQCMAAGAAAFLTKPLHGSTFMDAVKAATRAPARPSELSPKVGDGLIF